MFWLLTYTSLALATQAQPIAPESIESATPAPSLLSASHPALNAGVMQKHKIKEWSLPQPGPGPIAFTISETVILSESSIVPTTAASTSLFSADLINQHILMGWSWLQPGPGPSPTREAPTSSESNIQSTTAVSASLFSADLINKHSLLGWSLPEPGVKSRTVRAAPRPLPAHKAHGPRALLPYGPYASKGIRV